MSLAQHTLEFTISGAFVSKTLAEWGIVAAKVTRTLGASSDKMELVVRQATTSANLWPPFAVGRLRDPDGVARFTGPLTMTRRKETAGEQRRNYTFDGPWFYLQHLVYGQGWFFADLPMDFSSGFSPARSTKVILNRDNANGGVDVPAQLTDALAQAVAAGAPIAYNVSGAGSLQPPGDQQNDMLIGDVVKRTLEWCPHISCRWEYGDGSPTLVFGSTTAGESFGTAQVLDLDDTTRGITQFTGDPRADLLVRQVTVNYVGQQSVTDTDTGKQKTFLVLGSETSIVENGAFGAMESTIELGPLFWNAATTAFVPSDPQPSGLAAAAHEAFKQLYYDVTWTEQTKEVDWTREVGTRWSFEGAGAGFDEAQSVLQTIVRDIGSGVAEYTSGPPKHAGLGTLRDILLGNRKRHVPRDAPSRILGYGDPIEDPEKPPTGYYTFQDVSIDGVLVNAQVSGVKLTS
jgi:hypothetical protein